MTGLNEKELNRQRMLWYSFVLIACSTIIALLGALSGSDMSSANGIVGTSIGALSILGVGNYATTPKSM